MKPGVRFFDLGSLEERTDEFILIVCDGLWNVIGPDDAVTAVTIPSLPKFQKRNQRKCRSPGWTCKRTGGHLTTLV